MRPNLALTSILLFILSLAMLWILTLFETFLTGLTMNLERLLSALALVLPAALGVIYGILSLRRKEPKSWIAIAGILLNGAFAIFNLFILAFAG